MKIKRYWVAGMAEGLALIRKEMGPDAVILESKRRRQKGFWGFFLPRTLEITAAVDGEEDKKTEHKKTETVDYELNNELGRIRTMMEKMISQQKIFVPESGSVFNYWQDRLLRNDVDKEVAAEIIQEIKAASEGKSLTPEVTEALILGRIAKAIRTSDIPAKAKYLSFVGTTGVGKTTTLAKLAADFAFRQRKKTAIITVDTYRIGAVEQLKTYAEITGIPLEVVYTIPEMKQAVEKYRDYEAIFIDTAGRSSKSFLHIAETAQYINWIGDGIVYLVVSATTKLRDIRKIAEAYRQTNYAGLIITKLDETDTYGTILNVCKITSLPIAFVTTGQNIPDDINPADAGRLAEMVLGED